MALRRLNKFHITPGPVVWSPLSRWTKRPSLSHLRTGQKVTNTTIIYSQIDGRIQLNLKTDIYLDVSTGLYSLQDFLFCKTCSKDQPSPQFKEKFGENVTRQRLLDIALKEITDILNISTKPTASNVRILEDCIPQYVVGHYERVDDIRQYIQENNLPISLIGSSYDGVGINDVIFSAKHQVGD